MLASKYRLEELLGSGGMGHVYRAVNEHVGRAVAIKVLRAEHAENAQVVERFMREARTANLVRHPNVVDVLDIGREDGDGGGLLRPGMSRGRAERTRRGVDIARALRDVSAAVKRSATVRAFALAVAPFVFFAGTARAQANDPAPPVAAHAPIEPPDEPPPAEPSLAPAPAFSPPAPAPLAAPLDLELGRVSLPPRYTSWDANIEGGIGRVLDGPGETTGLLRARVGVLVIRDPAFFSVGYTYELSHLSAATLGVQAEYLDLDRGYWFQAGPLFDAEAKGRLGFMTATGYSLLGVEYQGRDREELGFSSTLFVKLRIPVGIIGFALRRR